MLIPHVIQLGKLQLLRRLIIRQVNFSARIESAQYQATLDTLNNSMLRNMDEIRQTARVKLVDNDDELARFGQDEGKGFPPQYYAMKTEKEQSANMKMKKLLVNMTACLENVGFVNPLNKVYNLTKDLDCWPLVACILTLQALQQLSYNPQMCSLMKKGGAVIDGPHFIMGLLTIFKQYHIN